MSNNINKMATTGQVLIRTLTDSLPILLITCDRKASCNTENRCKTKVNIRYLFNDCLLFFNIVLKRNTASHESSLVLYLEGESVLFWSKIWMFLVNLSALLEKSFSQKF